MAAAVRPLFRALVVPVKWLRWVQLAVVTNAAYTNGGSIVSNGATVSAGFLPSSKLTGSPLSRWYTAVAIAATGFEEAPLSGPLHISARQENAELRHKLA